MKSLLITITFLCVYISCWGENRSQQDSIHQQRMAVVQYVLDAVRYNPFSTDSIFNSFFDQELGAPVADDKTYHDWVNLYLSRNIDTLSEEEVKKISLLDKRILCHQFFFQYLSEKLRNIDPKDIQILPYTSVENPSSLSRGNAVRESEANDTYVIIFTYKGKKEAQYVLFNSSTEIRSMAFVIWASGEPISGVTFL